jgi:hypothetical protein
VPDLAGKAVDLTRRREEKETKHEEEGESSSATRKAQSQGILGACNKRERKRRRKERGKVTAYTEEVER